jgi:hypothetical protein
MMAPAMISPMRWGILSLFNNKGANKMMNNISENISTGFFRGNENFIASRSIIMEGV